MGGEKKKGLLLHVRVLFLLLYHSSLTLLKYHLTSDRHIDSRGTACCSDSK